MGNEENAETTPLNSGMLIDMGKPKDEAQAHMWRVSLEHNLIFITFLTMLAGLNSAFSMTDNTDKVTHLEISFSAGLCLIWLFMGKNSKVAVDINEEDKADCHPKDLTDYSHNCSFFISALSAVLISALYNDTLYVEGKDFDWVLFVAAMPFLFCAVGQGLQGYKPLRDQSLFAVFRDQRRVPYSGYVLAGGTLLLTLATGINLMLISGNVSDSTVDNFAAVVGILSGLFACGQAAFMFAAREHVHSSLHKWWTSPDLKPKSQGYGATN